MKVRFFTAPNIDHNNGKSTWQKVYVLTDDGLLYSEYLDYMKPSIDKQYFNSDTFQASDYLFNGYQPLTEVTEDDAQVFH